MPTSKPYEQLIFSTHTYDLKQFEALTKRADELEHAPRQVSHADTPKAIWPYSAGYGYTQFNSVRDWAAERQDLTRLLRALGAWVDEVGEAGKPLSIRHG